MTSYGSNSAVQYLVLKRLDSNVDNQTSAYRDIATAYINAKFNRDSDITSPNSIINQCANLLAAGLMASSAQTIDEVNGHPFIKQALDMLNLLQTDQVSDEGWGTTILTNRFNGSFRTYTGSEAIDPETLN